MDQFQQSINLLSSNSFWHSEKWLATYYEMLVTKEPPGTAIELWGDAMTHDLLPLSPRDVLQAIHRGPEAIVNLEGQPTGQWKALASLKVDELCTNSTVSPYLSGPSVYFSLSSVYAGRNSYLSPVTGLKVVSREQLRFINCTALDLDISHGEKTQSSFSIKVQEVLNFTVHASLPFPSLVSNSGRGLWLFWLLEDYRNPGTPLPAYPNLIAAHSTIQRAIVAAYKLYSLEVDASCTDSQRLCRFPGSLNIHTGTAAEYFRVSDRVFTLPEIATGFGVVPRKTQFAVNDVQVQTVRQQAGYWRWRRPLAGLKQLAEIRRRFKPGHRHTALYLFAVLGRRARVTGLREELGSFAAKYCVGLDSRSVQKCFISAKKSFLHISNATIVRMLEISEAELARLTLWTKPAKPSKTTQIQYRRSILAAELKLHGKVSVRAAVALLAKHGVEIGRSQVAIDLRSLTANNSEAETVPSSSATGQTSGVRNFMLVYRRTSKGTSVENRTPSTACEPEYGEDTHEKI